MKIPPQNGLAPAPDKYFAILEAAKKLFAEKGFDSATMREVAMQAGVAERTIYEYFKNKEDLLLSITKEYFKLYKAKLDGPVKSQEPAKRELVCLFSFKTNRGP